MIVTHQYRSSDEFSPSLLQIEGIMSTSLQHDSLHDVPNGDGDKLTEKLDTGAELRILLLHLYNKLQKELQ